MAALSERAEGVFIISATPFQEDGRLDLPSMTRLIEAYLAAGVHGMTILGVMGEANKLAGDEALTVARHVLGQVAGRVPVVVGVSAPGLDPMRALAHEVMAAGAAGVMLAPPPPLPTDERYEGYVHGALEALGPDVPVVLQDYPALTGVHMSVPVFLRLVEQCPQIKVLKHEDWPGLRKLTRVRKQSAEAGLRRVAILVGNSALFYPLELGRGADGAMTGFAFPEMLVEVYRLFASARMEAAHDLYDAYLPLVRYEQQPGIGLAIRKEILRRRGLITSARTRAPGAALDDADHDDLSRLLLRLERRLKELGHAMPASGSGT